MNIIKNKQKDIAVMTFSVIIDEKKEEVYIVRSTQNYYLNFNKSNISYQEIEAYLLKSEDLIRTITAEVEFFQGNSLLDTKSNYAIVHQLFLKKQSDIEMLVGMTDDYNGRHFIAKYNTEPVLLTSFYSNEEYAFNTFMKFLNMLFPKDDFITKHKGNYYIYTQKKATLFNKYYTYSKENIGYLNQQMFDTDEKKINFIIGTFIRNGKMNEKNEIEINFSNSLSHYQAVQDYVAVLKWKVVEIEKSKNTIPQLQKIIFMPNKESLKAFKKYSQK